MQSSQSNCLSLHFAHFAPVSLPPPPSRLSLPFLTALSLLITPPCSLSGLAEHRGLKPV